MDRLQKALVVFACIIASVLLLSLSFDLLGEVPSLSDLNVPNMPKLPEHPELPSTPNPEVTSLDSLSGTGKTEPSLRVYGPTDTRYLRLLPYSKYLSGTWEAADGFSVSYEGDWLDLPVNLFSSMDEVSFAIELLADIGEYLPTAPNTVNLNLTASLEYNEETQTFSGQAEADIYNLTYINYEFSGDLLNHTSVEYLPEYLEVPDYLEEDLVALAEEITENATTSYEQIVALQDYLMNHYDYNLSCPSPPPGVDPLEYFLYESGEGVCIHFNTALTMLARSLNISARLVGGYYIDPNALIQDVYPIQQHAFTEVSFEDLGWIIFDATPGADIQSVLDSLPDMNYTLPEIDPGIEGLDDFVVPIEGELPDGGDEVFKIFGVTGTGYLRDGVGEFYNGSWYSRSSIEVPYNGYYIEEVVSGYETLTEYHFYVEPSQVFTGFIPSPSHTTQLHAEANLTYVPEQSLFYSYDAFNSAYEVITEQITFNETILEAAEAFMNEAYLQIPEPLNSKIRPLAEQISQHQSSAYGKVKALEQYLKTQYPYNLSYTYSPSEVDPVEWFLFNEQQGVCTNFNSALVLLARSLGIPARLVTGYLIDPAREMQVVVSGQAHAYAEVLFDDLGWVTFDATPAATTEEPVEVPGRIPTNTTITYQDEYVFVGSYFTVAGVVQDNEGQPITELDILVYLKENKSLPGILAGKGRVVDGVFNLSCLFPVGLPGGEYMVDAHTLGNDVYLGSWSDPPIVSLTETSFLTRFPDTAITGKEVTFTGVIVEKLSNLTLPEIQFEVETGVRTFQITTDDDGAFAFNETYIDPGSYSVELSWEGQEFLLGANIKETIKSVDLLVEPFNQTLVRKEGSLISGIVHADGVPGVGEALKVNVLEDELATLTDDDGRFSLTYKTPLSQELGPTPIEFTILSTDRTSESTAIIVARPRLSFDSERSIQVRQPYTLKTSLRDDRDTALANRFILLRYWYGEDSWNQTLFTDEAGMAEATVRLTEFGEDRLHFQLAYDGESYLLPVTLSGNLDVVAPQDFPYMQAAALLAGAAVIGGLVFLQKKQATRAHESVNGVVEVESKNTKLTVRLPQIEAPFPNVWGMGEELHIELMLSTSKDSPISGPVNLDVNGKKIEIKTDQNGLASTSMLFDEKGWITVTAVYSEDGLKTSLQLKLVEYREEITELFNEKFEEACSRFTSVNENYTARELLEFLKKETPERTHGSLGEMTYLFEEANYSLHPVGRNSYERFYLAMHEYEEALSDGETG
ncbi:MAG: transglutaminase-like domain-containing protein [Candidatus Bathyarchaeota archaeon]|nr:transglutaminase-like domain-containing protein [Candidatus Bathyarchaeota archaeon]